MPELVQPQDLGNSNRGEPRVQYERTYVLLPQDHDAAWAKVVIEAIWDDERYTIGSSADDAGIGDLDVRKIIAVNPSHWPSDLKAFFDEYYPEIEYLPVEASTPEELAFKLKGEQPQSCSLSGTHDQAGAEWMVANNAKGWCVIPLYLNTSAIQVAGLERYRDAGINIILRLNYSYAVDDGGQGTMPGPDKIHSFEQACIETIECSPAAWGFIYCNEMNNPREWPEHYNLTPDYYTSSYNTVYRSIPRKARLAPGSIDPYNPGWQDWRIKWRQVLDSLVGAEFMAFHCYTHGWEPELVRTETKFGDLPLTGVYYDMKILETQQAIVPERFRDLPQVVTETNGIVQPWPDNGAWVREAYRYFRERDIAGACLFRYNYDQWRYGDKPEVLKILKEESK